jgi:hypothetical protein
LAIAAPRQASPYDLASMFENLNFIKNRLELLKPASMGSALYELDKRFTIHSTSIHLLNSLAVSVSLVESLGLWGRSVFSPSFADLAIIRSAIEVTCVSHWILSGDDTNHIHARRLSVLGESNRMYEKFSDEMMVNGRRTRRHSLRN